MMVRYARTGWWNAALGALALGAATPAVADGPLAAADTLADGFRDPPPSARPRVWWHWMNGNITEDGIAKDLAWMKRVGIAGVQTFDANLSTPQVVPQRLVYMHPEWKRAFRFAATEADRLGLELAIAASPGWSETGGPWVKPQDALKKLVWSETAVAGGRPYAGRLAAPPAVTGPFQALPVSGGMTEEITGERDKVAPSFYADVAVLAYPVAVQPVARPAVSATGGGTADAAAILDADLGTAIAVPPGTVDAPAAITLSYDRPAVMRSATVFIPGARGAFGGASLKPRIEASDDAQTWRAVADFEVEQVPTTLSFPATRARYFRLVLQPVAGYNGAPPGDIAPGVAAPQFGGPAGPQKPIRVAQFDLNPDARVDRFEQKAGFALVPDYYALAGKASPDEEGAAPDAIVDLTGRMKPDGTLDWTPPKGQWRVLRLGWSLLGTTNHPAPPEATGLEVDKFDGVAVRGYLDHYLGLYRDAAGADLVGARGVRALLTDSIEVGAANWTPRMAEQFRRLRGYDPTPWLPTLTGALIGTRAQSDAFLYDYRRTLADLMASEHYGTVAAVAHENGLKIYGEALETGRPSLGDDMAMRSHADVPMAAMWAFGAKSGPRPSYLADIKGAASVAHIYGQNLVAAESMTSALSPWAYAPADLKRIVDLEFALGVNRPVVHTSVHQPVDDKVPGLALFVFGQYFNRHETWAEMAKPWVDYMARSSFMLQQGRNVADVAYFYGEEAPLTGLYGEQPVTDAPKAYAYDFVNADVVLNRLSVADGDLASASGARYRVLYLGGSSRRMTLPVLRRLAALVEGGATIVGDAPEGSPSLKDDRGEYAALVRRLWNGRGVTAVGRGRVVPGRDVESALRTIGVQPDFAGAPTPAGGDLLFVHRKLVDGDAYYLNNRSGAQWIDARFRVAGKVPELWHADTGRSEPVSYRTENGVTVVPLDLAAEDAVFVVFRRQASALSATVAPPAMRPIATLAGPWSVSFQPGRGAPASATLADLRSLADHADPRIRYFSGVATYSRSFDLPRGTQSGAPMLLDLGKVGDLAEVRVNGRLMGTAWHAPYRIDVGGAVKAGRNRLEVRVANLWVNRLVGDAQPGAAKITWTAMPTYRADAPLRPSGLIGPVTLLQPAAAR